MKYTAIYAAIFALAITAQAAPPPVKMTIESDWQQCQALQDLCIQQGASMQIQMRMTTGGKYLDLSGLTARWEARESVTNTSVLQVSSTLTQTNTTPHYFQFDLTAANASGTSYTNWVWSLIVVSSGADYVIGTGAYNVASSSWTGAGSTTITNAAYLQTVAVDGTTITGDGTTGNPLIAAGVGDFLADGTVPMTGDFNGGGQDMTNIVNFQFDGGTGTQGTVSWNTDEETIDIILNGSILQVGQEWGYHAKNQTGVQIDDGTPVYASGTMGASGRILIAPYIANGTIPAYLFLGAVSYDIPNGSNGFVTAFGKVRGLSFLSSFSDGDLLYPSATVAGGWTNVAPAYPNIALLSSFVIDATPSGTMQVRVNNLDANEFATAAQGLLADSAIQTELDPSNAVHVANATGAHDASAIGTTGTYANVQAWFDAQAATLAPYIQTGDDASLNTITTTDTAGTNVLAGATFFRSLVVGAVYDTFSDLGSSDAFRYYALGQPLAYYGSSAIGYGTNQTISLADNTLLGDWSVGGDLDLGTNALSVGSIAATGAVDAASFALPSFGRYTFDGVGGNDFTYSDGNSIITYVNNARVWDLASTGAKARDDKYIAVGADKDYWGIYDSTDTRYEFWSTSGGGGSTDAMIYSIEDGADDPVFEGDITAREDATNTCALAYWSASNRWAMVQVIGSTTNVTFVSP